MATDNLGPFESKDSKVLAALGSVNFNSTVAVYEQIEANVQSAIAGGLLKDNDQLPSVRDLSLQLEVNPNTVAKAYRDLEVMGLLYTRRGMGIFVAKGAARSPRIEASLLKLGGALHEAVASLASRGFTLADVEALVEAAYKSGVHPFGGLPQSMEAELKRRRKAA